MKRGWPALVIVSAIVLTACTRAINGDVRDATSDRPVANAEVEVTTSGWGRRGGQLVWDKDYAYRARTGPEGRFEVDGVDGGHRLTVRAAGYPVVVTSLCSRSPMTIRVGGPFDGGDMGKLLSLGTRADGTRTGWSFAGKGQPVAEAEADLVALRAVSIDHAPMPLRAPLGMAFRPGTGNPPQAPASGYATERTIDLLRECGWLFVRTADVGTVPVRVGSFGVDEPLEGGRFLTLTYAQPLGR